jgi:hypothetical protein
MPPWHIGVGCQNPSADSGASAPSSSSLSLTDGRCFVKGGDGRPASPIRPSPPSSGDFPCWCFTAAPIGHRCGPSSSRGGEAARVSIMVRSSSISGLFFFLGWLVLAGAASPSSCPWWNGKGWSAGDFLQDGRRQGRSNRF